MDVLYLIAAVSIFAVGMLVGGLMTAAQHLKAVRQLGKYSMTNPENNVPMSVRQ